MKGALLFTAILALALLVIPMVALSFQEESPARDAAVTHTPEVPQIQQQQPEPAVVEDTVPLEPLDLEEMEPDLDLSTYGVTSFRILDQSTGEVLSVPLQDYVRGAVAAEMPVTFHPEALKAQAVAAHTYALYQHTQQAANPDPSLKGADFSADPSNMLIYITEETARNFYGENADLYWSKICEAADSVLEYVMEYEGEPIVAAYHAMSAGQTEDAGNVWIGNAPYLQASDSEGDYLAPDFETTVVLSQDAVRQTLLAAYPAIQLPIDPAIWFSSIQRSDSGYITSVDVGGVELHGKDIRSLFDLRSHNMEISYNPDSGYFTFTVYGYGHGVGLSQYGADFMARQGYDFEQILRNYYTGVTLKKVSLSD